MNSNKSCLLQQRSVIVESTVSLYRGRNIIALFVQ